MPPAVLLSISVHLVAIFDFRVSPTSSTVFKVADRTVTALLAPSQRTPAASALHAAAYIAADATLRRIDLPSGSGVQALGRAAMHTVRKLAPFAPFLSTLAGVIFELAIVRLWQFRR